MDKTSLGDRMKSYENVNRHYLIPRTPAIIRVDGKSFHTLTRGCKKPFDKNFAECMDAAALHLMEEVQNARFAYVQSDEISILLIDYNKYESQQWFDGNIQKIVSVSAGIASATFSIKWDDFAVFDSRVFTLPEKEIINYFIWRQQDATRNSIQMVAQSLYSHNALYKKSCEEMQEMVWRKGVNWNIYESYWKRGRVITKEVDRDIPIFVEDREYLEKFLQVEES